MLQHTSVICLASFRLTQLLILPHWTDLIVPCLGSCLAGTFGGLVSNIITARRIYRSDPQLPVPPPANGWKHGLSGDIIIGVAIGLVTFWSGIADVPISKILVASLIGGVSGAKYFSQQQDVKEARSQARKEKSRSAILKKTAEVALTPSLKGKADAEK